MTLLAAQVWAQGSDGGFQTNLSRQGSKPSNGEPASPRQSSGAYLGVFLGDVNDERARELKLPEIRGAVIGKIEMDSPGEKAGLKEDDVILSFNEQKIQNRRQVHRLLTEAQAGSSVSLGISREGKTQILSVVLGERRQAAAERHGGLFSEVNALLDLAERNRQEAEELKRQGNETGAAKLIEEEKAVRQEAETRRAYIEKELREGRIEQPAARSPDPAELATGLNRSQPGQLGVTAVELTEQLAQFFNVNGVGVLVTEVRAGEPAETAGIKAGDCIVAINGNRIKLPGDLARIRSEKDGKDLSELAVTIIRDRSERVVKIKIESR